MPSQILPWVSFSIFVIVMLVLDLGVFHRKAHEVKFKESLIWSGVWILLALLFNVIIYFWHGPKTALEFLTGYLIEKSLSIDNLFVFLMLFSYFSVPPIYQHRVLFWGIVGALIIRAIFIATGITLIHKFYWLMYILGAFLIITGIKMALQKDKEIHPERNPVLKLLKRFVPVTDHYEDGRFFIKKGAQHFATPLLVVLIAVETTDIIFALDSVPAILAITTDPFIVYTSNVFAILGLRSIYFALAGMMRLFHYLNYGLSGILAFVGMKMLISEIYKIPIGIALGVVAGILAISVLASIAFPRKTEPKLPSEKSH